MVAAAAFTAFADGPVGEPFVFEPSAEAADAAALGAAEVEAAQKKAKAKEYASAAEILEGVARRLPASVHDCNLALAYLRANLLVRAKLAWDLSALRNGVRPKWCTGEVSSQLSEALRGSRYAPATVDVVPRDAVIDVMGARVRNMPTVWLPAQPVPVTVSAPGYETQTTTVAISAPSARIAVTLVPLRPAGGDAPIDAGVTEPVSSTPPDAGVVATAPTPDAGVTVTDPNQDALIRIGGTPVGYRAAALTTAVVGWVGAAAFGYAAYHYKQKADDRYPTDPAFQADKDRYGGSALLSLGMAALGAVGTGVYVYFITRDDEVIRKPGAVQVGVGAGASGVGVTFGGSW